MSRVFSHTSCAIDGSKFRLVIRVTINVRRPPVKMAARLPASMLISAPIKIRNNVWLVPYERDESLMQTNVQHVHKVCI